MPDIEIFMAEGKPMVSSRLIADHFGKQHKHVLDAIREVVANTPESFNGPNFRPVEYRDAKGEKRPPGVCPGQPCQQASPGVDRYGHDARTRLTS